MWPSLIHKISSKRLRILNRAYKIIEKSPMSISEMMKLDLMAVCTYNHIHRRKIALEGVIRELRKLLNKTIFEDILLWLFRSLKIFHSKAHELCDSFIMFTKSNSNKLLYPLHFAVAVSFPLLSPFIFVHFFFLLFLFKSPIVSLAKHNGHYLCLNDLNCCEERRHKKSIRKTFNRPSSRLLVDILLFIIAGAVLSCFLCIAYPFYSSNYWYPLSPQRHLCPCADLLTSLQFFSQQLCAPTFERERPSEAKEKKEKHFFYVYRRSFFFIQIM